jgi:hypothetical protein
MVGWLLLPASGASAAGAGAVSFTQTFHNATDTFTDVVPCVGPSDITITYDGVFHVTTLTSGIGAGTFWVTGTQTGDITAVSQATGVTYTGHFAIWFGDNDNLRNDAETFTLNVKATGSDGSTLNGHLLGHVTVTATGVTISFDHLTCS